LALRCCRQLPLPARLLAAVDIADVIFRQPRKPMPRGADAAADDAAIVALR